MTKTPKSHWPNYVDPAYLDTNTQAGVKQADLFSEENGVQFAGKHLLLDCRGASHLDDITLIEDTIRKAIDVSGATLLHIHLHHFTPNGGVSGVAVLAESHISIHTWPERQFAALDIFMCGETQPEKTIAVFKEAFETDDVQINMLLRGASSG